jgi:hypothetical protein
MLTVRASFTTPEKLAARTAGRTRFKGKRQHDDGRAGHTKDRPGRYHCACRNAFVCCRFTKYAAVFCALKIVTSRPAVTQVYQHVSVTNEIHVIKIHATQICNTTPMQPRDTVLFPLRKAVFWCGYCDYPARWECRMFQNEEDQEIKLHDMYF